jgi:REP element-mobilizing transposase RayT
MVWTTKNRIKFLTKDIRSRVFIHMKENAALKGIHLDFVNGYENHVHCLVSLTADMSVAIIANLIKGESSHWINENKLTKSKFAWQSEYWAAGVGEKEVERVIKYIKNQEKHHNKNFFEEELEEFIKYHGFSMVE